MLNNQLLQSFQQWLAINPPLAEPSIDTYFYTIKNFFNYAVAFDRLNLKDIDPEFLRTFIYIKRDGTPYSPASIKVREAAVGIFLGWVYEQGYCGHNILLAYRKARIKHKPLLKSSQTESPVAFLSPALQQKILSRKNSENFTEIRTRCLITLILACALFAEEITTLPYSDFHFEEGYLEIKGDDKRERKITFDIDFCRDACNAWLTLRKQTLAGHGQPLLFFTQNFAPVSKLVLRKSIYNYLHQIGIPQENSTPDALRQTAICNMLLQGLSIEEVKARTEIKTLQRLERYQKATKKLN